MNFNWFKKDTLPSERKSGELEALIEAQLRGTGSGNKRVKPMGITYESFSKEGYMSAVAVYYCISLISQKAGTVPVKLFQKAERKEDRTEIYSHPILDLLQNPSPIYDKETYLESFLSYFLLDGNVYERPLEAFGKVKEMVLYEPTEVEVVYNKYDKATGYKVTVDGKEHVYPIKKLDMSSKIKHFKNFNPLNKYEGLSPLRSASTVVDILNNGDIHNLNMLRNEARPSGALSYEPADGAPQTMDEEQFERLKEEIREQYSGSENTGRPLLLEGGLKWVQMSLNARDLDYLNSRGVSQKDVCRAYKVPAVLLGLDNDSTYNNVREARLGLWDDAIIPNLNRAINHWNKHILPMFEGSEGLVLEADYSKVSDLETRTERIWKRLDGANFVTLNEKRNIIGLDPIEGGDTTFISSGDMPLELLNLGVQASNINEIVSAGAQAMANGGGSDEKDPKKPKDTTGVKKSYDYKASDEALYRMIDNVTIQFEKKMGNVVVPFMKKYGEDIEKAIIKDKEMGLEFGMVLFSDKLAKAMAPQLEDIITTFGEMTLRDITKKSDGRFEYKDDLLVADVITQEQARNILTSSVFVERVAKYVEQEAVVRAKFIEDSSRNAIRGILSEGIRDGRTYVQMAKEARGILGDSVRSMRIVRTEVHTAREFASDESARMTGLDVVKRWLSSVDERTRATHITANGQKVKINEKFIVGSSLLDHPGDPSGSAKECINCRCTTTHEVV